MGNLTVSEKYGLAAAIALMLMVAINSALVMLVVSVLGLSAGFWVMRQSDVRRVAYVALAGFAISAVFGIIGLMNAR